MDLRGSTAVVTGASSGIGWATAWALAAAGADVVVAGRREERVSELASAVLDRGRRALAVRCDVSSREDVERLRDRTLEAFGRADVLINNAGVPGGGPFDRLSLEQIEQVVRINLLGVLYCTKAFLPGMIERGSGHVVNVASLAGRYAVPGSSVYSATKHAVVAFSESAYFELKPKGIVMTTVNPGLVATEGFPHRDRRRGVMKPERIARAIVEVVRAGRGPEVSVPRYLAPWQAFRILTPRLYRFGLERATRREFMPTPTSDEPRDGG